MQKNKNKNLFLIKTPKDRILYRVEGGGYCFYICKIMKFYFVDKITGTFYLNALGQLSKEEIEPVVREVLGYAIEPSILPEVGLQYIKSLPLGLINVL